MTRHPGTGAARERRVSVREPVESRAAKGKNPAIRLLSSNRRLAEANLLIFIACLLLSACNP
jgi:hypothetical protein